MRSRKTADRVGVGQRAQEVEMTMATTHMALDRCWPEEGVSRVRFCAYTDPQVYEQEMRLIFCGESWAYVGLEVEIPHPGDFKQSTLGDRSVVMVRDEHGVVRVFVNRCAHRGVKLCRVPWGQ